MAFRQRRAVCAHQQRQVAVGGRTQLQRFENQQLARRIGEVVFTAQHVRDTHLGIIDGIAEKERRAAVGTPQDEIADVVGGEALGTVHHVIEFHAPAVGHAEPRRRRDALRALAHARFGGEFPAGSGITWRAAGGELRLARQIQLERRAVAGIREPAGIERGRMSRVDLAATRLPVFLAGLGAARTRIPLQPHPLQILHQRRGVGLLAAFGIRVLDAQNEAPAVVAREQPAEQRSTCVAEMELARGAGSEACGDGSL